MEFIAIFKTNPNICILTIFIFFLLFITPTTFCSLYVTYFDFRQKIAKKNLSQRRAQAIENARAGEERALRTQMALRIQCAYRGKQGRLGAHLRDQARKFREEEEANAARAIQSRLRGRATR